MIENSIYHAIKITSHESIADSCEALQNIRWADLTNLSATAQAGTFIHGKLTCGDITLDIRFRVQVATLAFNIAFHLAVNMHLTSVNITLDIGLFTNSYLTGFRFDLAFDVTIDVHVILETNGTDNLNTGRKNVNCVHSCNLIKIAG